MTSQATPSVPATPQWKKGPWVWIGLAAVVVLIVLFILFTFLPPPMALNFASDTIALGIIAAVAVGIERIIEGIWTILELVQKYDWPLGNWETKYEELVNRLDEKSKPLVEQVNKTIAQINTATKEGLDHKNDIAGALQTLQGNLLDLKITTRTGKFQEAYSATLNGIGALQKILKDDNFNTVAGEVSTVIDDVSDFVSSFKENPGRRLISIYLGMLLGLIVAWAAGLDMFKATLGTGNALAGSVNNYLGVAFTGLIIGLGANPTHEVIQLLKEVKLNRKAVNS